MIQYFYSYPMAFKDQHSEKSLMLGKPKKPFALCNIARKIFISVRWAANFVRQVMAPISIDKTCEIPYSSVSGI